jgi:hypothetical protein
MTALFKFDDIFGGGFEAPSPAANIILINHGFSFWVKNNMAVISVNV